MVIEPSNDAPVRTNESRRLTPYQFPTPFITPALIAINVLVFLAMLLRGVPLLGPTAQQVLPWGANFGPLTMSGQWWRLLTACFLHFGIIHIGMNMYILYQIGMFTERLFGNFRYLLLYLVAGIGGNIAGLFFHPMSVGAGASGAIFGVYGGLLGFLLVERSVVPKQNAISIAKSAMLFLGYNLIFGLARPETDLVAHGGGLFTGFVAGCALAQPLLPGRRLQHAIRAGIVAAVAILLAVIAISRLPRPEPSQSFWYTQLVENQSISAGNHDQLVYSGTATKTDAEKMAQALVSVGLFRTPQVVLLYTKSPSSASLTIPLRDENSPATNPANSGSVLKNLPNPNTAQQPHTSPWNDPRYLARMRFIGPQLASAAGVLPFSIRLVNSSGELKNELKIDTTEVKIDTSELAAGTLDRVSYSGDATPEQASALAKALESAGFFRHTGALVFLSVQGGVPTIGFYTDQGTWNDPHVVARLRDVAQQVAPSVGGPPVKVQLIDAIRHPQKEFTVPGK